MSLIRTLIVGLLTVGLAGCASAPGPDEGAVAAVPEATPATPPSALGWLDPEDPAVIARAEHCHMLQLALADTGHSWLWLDLDMSDLNSVRVTGPGALSLALRVEGVILEVPDTGLYVALDADANAFLNSARGPITIRAGKVAAVAGHVRLLARLPAMDTARTAVHHVDPVPDRWITK